MCSLPEDLCPNAEDWQRPQLRRRLGDPTPWPRPRWRAASRDCRADRVAAPHPGRDKRLRVVGPLGEPHGVVSSPAAPHPCYGPVGRLVQEQGAVETRSHRDRSHRWRGSLGQRDRSTIPPFVKHGRVWWVGILGEAEAVAEAGVSQPESRRWRSSDGQMAEDRTHRSVGDTGTVWPFAAVRTAQRVPVDGVVGVGMPFAAGTALSWRIQDFPVQPGARPSEALGGVRKLGHAEGCRVRPHRAPLAGDPWWGWSHSSRWRVAFEPSAERSGLRQEQRHESGKTPWQLQDFGPDWKSRRQLRRWCPTEGHQGDGLHRSAQRHVCQSEWRFAVDWATCCYHTMCSVGKYCGSCSHFIRWEQ